MSTWQEGYGADALAFNQFSQSLEGDSVESGCTPSDGTNAMEVDIAAGEVIIDGSTISVSAQTVTLNTSDTDPRKDVVYIDSTGSAVPLAGTPAPAEGGTGGFDTYMPTPPAMSGTTGVPVALVWVGAGVTDIGSTDIWDRTQVGATGEDIHKSEYNVKDYGADGDGVADDSTAIQDAINAAEADGGGIVYFPRGTYYITAQLSVSGNNITFQGEGKLISKLDCSGIAASTYAVDVSGVNNASYAISSTSDGDTSVTCSTASNAGNFSKGQLVLIRSDDAFESSGVNETEVNVVESSDSTAGTVSLQRPVEAAYSTTPTIHDIDAIENFRWDSLGLEYPDLTNSWYGPRINLAKNAVVNNAYFKRCNTRAITNNNSYNTTIEGSVFEESVETGYGYGVNVSQASTVTTIRDCDFLECRHGVAHSGATYGIQRYSRVIDCSVSQPNHDIGLDSHGESEYITFRDNSVHGCGISLRGYRSKAMGNDIISASNYAIAITGATIQKGITIHNNFIYKPKTRGIVISGNGHIGLEMTNNRFVGTGSSSGISATLFNGPVEASIMTDNTIDGFTSGIYLRNVDSVAGVTRTDLNISDNNIRNCDDGIWVAGDGTGGPIYSDVLVTDNDLTDNVTNAIYDTGLDDSCIIENNLGVPIQTVTLSSNSAVVSTGITTPGTVIDVALDPSGDGANAADVKVSARAFWDNSVPEYKVEILEDGTNVGNPTVGYKVVTK